MRFFQDLGRLGLAVSFIFLLCGTLRLARFNANIDKVTSEYFQGLPSPAAAMALIGLILFSIEFPVLLDWTVLPFIYVLFYAFLMISTIPFNSFKNSTWAKKHKRFSLFVMMILLVLTLTYEQFMIAGGISFYVIGSLIYFFTHKGALEDVLQWKTDTDGDA
jgi:CDP-diacylglycerol--serine O-phosphatidyltransferase